MQNQPPPRILLADEDPGVRRTLGLVLTRAGYRVSTAEHTLDAILVLQRLVPDLIIFDLELEHVPGYDFLAMVRDHLPQVPVIATSIFDDHTSVPEDVLADSIYIKGFGRTERLLQTVANLVRASASRSPEKPRNAHHLQDTTASSPRLKVMRAAT
ncbi:MAG TPA: response regulator [Candidatus Angelobacter sp.]|nr:response regulator [Candidatus Angelobacter sp.]